MDLRKLWLLGAWVAMVACGGAADNEQPEGGAAGGMPSTSSGGAPGNGGAPGSGGTPASGGAAGGSGGGAMLRSEPIDPACLQALEGGTCDVGVTRYAFDAAQNQCKPVAACDGTPNRFESEAACAAACKRETVECPSAPSMAGQPCAQVGAGCSQWTFYYGYYGFCTCQQNGTWFCAL